MADRILGIDVSRWQGNIDWSRVAQADYKFAVIRATVGDYYTDPKFEVNWRDAEEAGMLLSAYHVIIPGQTVSAQMDRFFEVLAERENVLPLVLDVELTKKPGSQKTATKEEVADTVRRCADTIEAKNGRKPIIYTGAWFWNPNVARDKKWADYDLWVANYGADSPRLPADWDDWRLWQYTDKGKVPGVSSTHTDINAFNGSLDEFLLYTSRQSADDPEPTEEPTPVPPAPKRLGGKVVSRGLNVRRGPGAKYGVVDQLKAGDEIEVFDVGGRDAWVQIGPNRWVAVIVNGRQYIDIES